VLQRHAEWKSLNSLTTNSLIKIHRNDSHTTVAAVRWSLKTKGKIWAKHFNVPLPLTRRLKRSRSDLRTPYGVSARSTAKHQILDDRGSVDVNTRIKPRKRRATAMSIKHLSYDHQRQV